MRFFFFFTNNPGTNISFQERFLENFNLIFRFKSSETFFLFFFLKKKPDTLAIESRDIYPIASTLLRNQAVYRRSTRLR